MLFCVDTRYRQLHIPGVPTFFAMNISHQELWNRCLGLIRREIGEEQFEPLFGDISSLSFENNELRLLVPSAFFVEYIEGKYLVQMGHAIHAVYGNDVQVHYHYNVIGGQPDTRVDVKPGKRSTAVPPPPQDNLFNVKPVVEFDPHLNPKFTFENYCCSASNKDAVAIAETIADNPSIKTFNPLMVFGPTGVGKTHLIQAIGIRIKEKTPTKRVLYVTARDFESQYTIANGKGDINKFFAYYQSIDTLIVDDIQDLNNKPGTQNTFFNIFNHLHLNSRQIILSSDRAPSEMEGIEDRLLGRFKWGMSVALERPDLFLRRNVLRQNADREGVVLPEDVLEYIAANVVDNIRELEGVLCSLVAHATVMSKPMSIELARMVVGNAVKLRKRTVDFELIANKVSEFYNIDSDLLFTKSRKREISDARQVVMYLAKKMANMPSTAIGHRLGRSHATVIYAVQHIGERVALEKPLRDEINKIEAAIMA